MHFKIEIVEFKDDSPLLVLSSETILRYKSKKPLVVL